MNIFVVDYNPKIAAQMLCDKHVVKMILESAQMLCTPFENAPYKKTHYNHPCSVWVRKSRENYQWLVDHAYALVFEHAHRYGHKKRYKPHKSLDVIYWCEQNINQIQFEASGVTPFAQAMPDEYKQQDAVKAYREYYLGAKKEIAKWNNNRNPPYWWVSIE